MLTATSFTDKNKQMPRRPWLPALQTILIMGFLAHASGCFHPHRPEADARVMPPATGQELDAFARPLFPPDQPGGAVLVVRNGQVLLNQAYGLADVEHGKPLAPGMRFKIGSVTKQFTAALVLKLVEEGRIDLSAPIHRYVPEMPAAWAGVTVEQCLNHTGGLPDYTTRSWSRFVENSGRPMSAAQVLETYLEDAPLDFTPGSRRRYSNTGYLLAGMMLEHVAGESFESLMTHRLLSPLGLRNTGFGTGAGHPELAQGYAVGTRKAPFVHPSQIMAAGGLISTTEDLVAWARALFAGKVLRVKSLERMTAATVTSDGTSTGKGLGIDSYDDRDHRVFWHDGGLPGYASGLRTDPKEKTVVAVLINVMDPDSPTYDPSPIAQRLLEMACGRARPVPAAARLPESDLDALAGSYLLDIGRHITITRKGGMLQAQLEGSAPIRMFPVSATRFFAKVEGWTVDFVLGPDGKASSLQVLDEGATFRGERQNGYVYHCA